MVKMVKTFSSHYEFKHPWDQVTLSFWKKYPNELSIHVKEIDVYSRYITHCGKLVSHRLIRCQSPTFPYWLSSFGIPTSVYAQETTVVDPVAKTMVVKSRNINGSSIMNVEETCVYTQSTINPTYTTYHQSSHLNATIPMFSSRLESHVYQTVCDKHKQGIVVLEGLLHKAQFSK
jgi:hypothetical protein